MMSSQVRAAVSLMVLALIGGLVPLPAAAQVTDEPVEVLVWGGTYGYRHPSITRAELAFQELATADDSFNVRITENPAELTAAVLQGVDVLAWVNTTGKPPFTEQQRDDIIRHAACGGGTLAFHAAADSNYGWPEFAELLGAQFDSHPQNAGAGDVRMIVEDDQHTITEGWAGQDDFMLDDEYYRWRAAQGLPGISLPRGLGDTHVLLSMDETTVQDGIQDGPTAYEEHQPIAWTKTFRGGGRVYYNNMGHSESTWELAPFRTSIVNAIDWVSDVSLDQDCFAGDDPLPPAPTPPAPSEGLVGTACPLPAVEPRSGPPWQTSGEIRRLTEEGDQFTSPTPGLPGGLAWGAQFYVLDLAATGSATADVTVDMAIPVPSDDYDLSVTTGWGWYGSQAGPGATTEKVQVEDAPHCAILQVYADNMAATSQQAPSLEITVASDDATGTDPTSTDEEAPSAQDDVQTEADDLPVTGGAGSLAALGLLALLSSLVLGRTGRRRPSS